MRNEEGGESVSTLLTSGAVSATVDVAGDVGDVGSGEEEKKEEEQEASRRRARVCVCEGRGREHARARASSTGAERVA